MVIRMASMLRGVIACLSTSILTVPALADPKFDELELASDLGYVLASEEACRLNYDKEAIKKFVQDRVPADDLSFAALLSLNAYDGRDEVKEMNPSTLVALCVQVARVAKRYGFTH
jgi:hypothetical protein